MVSSKTTARSVSRVYLGWNRRLYDRTRVHEHGNHPRHRRHSQFHWRRLAEWRHDEFLRRQRDSNRWRSRFLRPGVEHRSWKTECLSITSGKVIVSNGNFGSFTSFTGGANLVVSGGTLRGDQGGTLTLNLAGSSSVQLTGSGNIGGAGTTINSGNFQWNGGTVSGNLSNSSTTFTISGGQELIFGGGTLSNSGTISQSGKSDLQNRQRLHARQPKRRFVRHAGRQRN